MYNLTMPKPIIGTTIVEKLTNKVLKPMVKEIKHKNTRLKKLAVIITQDTPEIHTYVAAKKQFFKNLGLPFQIFNTADDFSLVQDVIYTLNNAPEIAGILLQLPLADTLQHKQTELINLIAPHKDVEGLTAQNLGLLSQGKISIMSPVVEGMFWALRSLNIAWDSKFWYIMGAGTLVGKPLSIYLASKKVSFVLADKNNPQYDLIKYADIIVTGTGQDLKDVILKNKSIEFKPGAIILDAGTRYKNNHIHSDLDLPEDPAMFTEKQDVLIKLEKISYYTPARKSLGPLTVFSLAYNFLHLQLTQDNTSGI